jgi:hypothetical protein
MMMILAEVVFLTRFLGVVAGEQPVRVKVDPDVRQVQIQRDGKTVATLHRPPWGATVDFGPELEPHELTAVGLNAHGEEVGRDTQIINLARPLAEVGILLDRDPDGALTARVQWGHVLGASPHSTVMKLDREVISRATSGAPVRLPINDRGEGVHVVSVEIEFTDGVHAQKEIVFGGLFSEQMPAELTPVAVRQRSEDPKLTACFTTHGKSVAPTAVERGTATAYFVINGTAGKARRSLLTKNDSAFALPDADFRLVAPVPTTMKSRDSSQTEIFGSQVVPGQRGTRRLLIRGGRTPSGEARIADAVAAAALRALSGERRRAVVLVFGERAAADRSEHGGANVRRYLARIGVPLRVWSLTGPNPALEKEWGPIQDVSTAEGLIAATRELRTDLDSQRIVWLPLPPLDAFRVDSSASCGFEPLAQMD